MTVLSEASVGAPNSYATMHISKINNLGTEALIECVTSELQERELWDDPEVRWALDFSLMIHAKEQREDGPYVNHILRAAIWAVREFDTHNPEIAKVVFLHDVIENQPEAVIEQLGGSAHNDDLATVALDALRTSDKLFHKGTIEAIERITCPPFEGDRIRRRVDYARHIANKILPHPLAAIAKLADHIDNYNGNIHNPDPELRQRLDLKYYPLHQLFRQVVNAKISLLPDHRKAFVEQVLVTGHKRAKLRLLCDGHAPRDIAALTLSNTLSGNLPM